MSTRSMLLPVLALALTITACRPAAEGLSEEDVAAIRNLNEKLIQAELANDWDAVATLLTEDVVVLPANQPVVEGRASWQAWVESLKITITDLTATPVEIDGRDDLAYLRGTYSETYMLGGSPEPITDKGKYLWILWKQPDGSWLIAVGIANSDLPLPE